MSKENLSDKRLSQINSLKADLQGSINLYNQAFSGHQSFKKQNEIIAKLLNQVTDVQQLLLSIRDLNAQVLTQRQTDAQMQKLRRLQMSFSQMQNAMQSMNSLMIGDGSNNNLLELDNTNYSGGIKSEISDDADEEADGDAKNFSQPSGHPEALKQQPTTASSQATVSEHSHKAADHLDTASSANEELHSNEADNVKAADSAVNQYVADQSDAEMLAAQRQLEEAKARMAKIKAAKATKQQAKQVVTEESNTRSESEQADDHEAELQSSAHQKSELEGQAAAAVPSDLKHIPVRNADDSEVLRAQAEFEKHKRWAEEHPNEIKQRQAKSAEADHNLAIKWPGSTDYLNKQGHVVNPDNLEVRDVTPKEELKSPVAKDQDEAENAINEELGKLGL